MSLNALECLSSDASFLMQERFLLCYDFQKGKKISNEKAIL